jgi:hypothetical protein
VFINYEKFAKMFAHFIHRGESEKLINHPQTCLGGKKANKNSFHNKVTFSTKYIFSTSDAAHLFNYIVKHLPNSNSERKIKTPPK